MSTSTSRPEPPPETPPAAVLLMAHGTPDSLDDMPAYLTRVRGGRPPSPELVAEMRHNYEAIGGRSPLTDISRQQAAALQARLGPAIPVRLGMRTWAPLIAEAVRDLDPARIRQVIGIPLAPQFSTLSVQKYVEAALAALPAGIRFDCVHEYHAHPLLVDAFAERVRQAAPAPGEEVVFTAHALPERVIAAGDPYATQVAETARLVAARAGVARYGQAFQSAGRTPEPWIGPDLSEFIRAGAAQGMCRLLVVPIGFVCDHTEILFDIDVQAAATARDCGVALRRTESLNTLPRFIDTLAALVHDALGAPAQPGPNHGAHSH
ncbi:MAG: ferrochelatase [Acidobacteriota bacterium]|nr:ferrochelatase [Acidobacteriota bacterium]